MDMRREFRRPLGFRGPLLRVFRELVKNMRNPIAIGGCAHPAGYLAHLKLNVLVAGLRYLGYMARAKSPPRHQLQQVLVLHHRRAQSHRRLFFGFFCY